MLDWPKSCSHTCSTQWVFGSINSSTLHYGTLWVQYANTCAAVHLYMYVFLWLYCCLPENRSSGSGSNNVFGYERWPFCLAWLHMASRGIRTYDNRKELTLGYVLRSLISSHPYTSTCVGVGVAVCACLCAINEGSTNVVNVQIGMEANLTLDTFRYQLKN